MRDLYVCIAGFVCGDEVGKNDAKGRVREAIHILLGALDDLPRLRVTDIARFPVVVPWS